MNRNSLNKNLYKISFFRNSSTSAITPGTTGSQLTRQAQKAMVEAKAQERLAISQQRNLNLPTEYTFAGLNYAMPNFMAQRRLRLLLWNGLAGCSLAGFVVWIYLYSIWAVKQDDLSDEFLAEIELLQRKEIAK
jgi:hypothetical protein